LTKLFAHSLSLGKYFECRELSRVHRNLVINLAKAMEQLFHYSWRTLAYQEVRPRIGPLAKLGCLESTAKNFLVYCVTISLASGPI